MPLKKPIKAISRYILSPQFGDYFLEDLPDESWDRIESAFDKLLAELDGFSSDVTLYGEFPSTGRLTIKVCRLNKKDMLYIAKHSPMPEIWLDSVALEFCTEWHEPAKVAAQSKRSGRLDKRINTLQACINFTDVIARKILVLMSVYLPGSSRCHFNRTNTGLSYLDENLSCVSHFGDVAKTLSEKGLSITPKISFREFLEWSRRQEGYWSGIPTRNVGRALNYFSYTHHYTHQLNTMADISWLIAAVEALYSPNNVEIRARLGRRIYMVVPELVNIFSKKEVVGAYDFRSRFIHGDLPIPHHFSSNDYKPHEDYVFEFGKQTDIISVLLLYSLQRLSEQGAASLAFVETPSISTE